VGDGVEAGGRRGDGAIGDAAGESVPDGGEVVAAAVGPELPDRVVFHGSGGWARTTMQQWGVSGRVISSGVARSMAWIAARAVGCPRSARLGGSPEVAG
jgi:hypothetical protein